MNLQEWNSKPVVKLHIQFYQKIADITKDVDEILSQHGTLCVKAIKERDIESFNVYADFIKAVFKSDRELRKKLGKKTAKELFIVYRNYQKSVRSSVVEKRREKWNAIKKRIGLR